MLMRSDDVIVWLGLTDARVSAETLMTALRTWMGNGESR